MIEVICLGEMIIDMMAEDNNKFQAYPGGAPANVAINCMKLGHQSMFMGKRGDDPFGEMLNDYLKEQNVETYGFVPTSEATTGLAFVFREENADPKFFFYRGPSADELLDISDIPVDSFKKAKWFHFGSISLYSSRSRESTHYALKLARDNGLVISYDPNIRPHLIQDCPAALDYTREVCDKIDVLKVGEEELLLLANEEIESRAIPKLFNFGISIIAVTRGHEGSSVYTKDLKIDAKPPEVEPKDTTGAGDAFTSALICRLIEERKICKNDLMSMNRSELSAILNYASIISARSTQSYGATAGVAKP